MRDGRLRQLASLPSPQSPRLVETNQRPPSQLFRLAVDGLHSHTMALYEPSHATRPKKRRVSAWISARSYGGSQQRQRAVRLVERAFFHGMWSRSIRADAARQSTTRRPLLPSAQAAAVCCLPPARSWLRQPCRPRTSGRRRSMRRATRCARRRRPRQTSEWLHRRLRLPAPALTLADLSSGTL